jgi:microcin C transport system permease protein
MTLAARLTPLNRRRLENFRRNRRGWWSLWIFLGLFAVSLCAEVIANDRPLLVRYDGAFYVPVLRAYPETAFGGDFETEADYRDPFVREAIAAKGWSIWPPIPFGQSSVNKDLGVPFPAPPSATHWLGTDDQGRDVVARLVYGFRISVLFGLTLTIVSSVIGVAVGALQGYFGGWVDLSVQRFLEIWGGMPVLYLLIILSAFIQPSFWWLLALLLLFSWMALVDVVRAEFLRARNFDYGRAARALGAGDVAIMFRHVLPNAMVATLTLLPFIITGVIGSLAALDFLGFGLPSSAPSLGELSLQAKQNLQAPWLGFTAFFTFAIMLSLLVFIFEGVRDAFDPRKTFR